MSSLKWNDLKLGSILKLCSSSVKPKMLIVTEDGLQVIQVYNVKIIHY